MVNNSQIQTDDTIKPEQRDAVDAPVKHGMARVQRVETELKRQVEQHKEHAKPEVNAGRPADARLKAERKGVI